MMTYDEFRARVPQGVKPNRFLAIGLVRGWCGHQHKTIEAARACVQRDKEGCRQQGGYSDQQVYSSTCIMMLASLAEGSDV